MLGGSTLNQDRLNLLSAVHFSTKKSAHYFFNLEPFKTDMKNPSDPTTITTNNTVKAGPQLYNLIPPRTPRNLTNPNLYAGRSNKPIPIELSLPLRWQRGAQFLAVSLSISLVFSFFSFIFFILWSIGIWGVLFADHGNGDREIVFSPIRRWFAPYKALLFKDPTSESQSSSPNNNNNNNEGSKISPQPT